MNISFTDDFDKVIVDESQKYKEGKFILEKAQLKKEKRRRDGMMLDFEDETMEKF